MSGDVGHGEGASAKGDHERPGEGVSVLLADDDDVLRESLTMHLQSRGYEVHLAADGEEALAVARDIVPNIAILDIVMPKANGWSVARELRKNAETAGIGLLMLSGIGGEVLGPNLGALGGDLGLDKPFELDELDEALRILLDSQS